MNQSFTLQSPELVIELKTIDAADQTQLREWKNANRFAFFYQDLITPEQQAQWFQKYLQRANDYMFIVRRDARAIGCMGFRVIDGAVDIYNVIRGEATTGKRGEMGQAMRLMNSFILANFSAPIIAQVLRNNPAIEWYAKNFFVQSVAHETYFEMQLDVTRFRPCRFTQVAHIGAEQEKL
jgi:hypothetical protein